MGKNQQTVYLDNNATTELSENVSQVIVDMILHSIYGNPSSQHEMGVRVKTIMDAARFGVAQSLHCSSEEIIFTSGGTESNNLALRGMYCSDSGIHDDLVVTAVEHSSVYRTAERLASPSSLKVIPVLTDGSLDMEAAKSLITEGTSLVSVMLANNITGNLYPVKEIAKLAHSVGAVIHCDAVQAYGKIPIDVQELDVDLLTISGHKVHALPGVGALYLRKGLILHPMLTGGPQESMVRAGSENYIGVISLATVANAITHLSKPADSGLRDVFERGILNRIPDIVVNGSGSPRTCNTSSVTFKGVRAVSMLRSLEAQGVLASAGSACSSESSKPSRVLTSMGISTEDALCTVRFSFSNLSKLMDAALAIEACVKSAKTLRKYAKQGENNKGE